MYEESASKLQSLLEDLTNASCETEDDEQDDFEEEFPCKEVVDGSNNYERKNDSSQILNQDEVETIYINGKANIESEHQKADCELIESRKNKEFVVKDEFIKYNSVEYGVDYLYLSDFDKLNYLNNRQDKINILKQKNIVSIEEKHEAQTNLFQCSVCGKTFRKKVYLKEHMDLHSKQKSYTCQFCGKSFTRRTVLVKHRRIHTHPKFYMCEMCGRSFNDKGTLTTHIKLLHIKERNFLCEICNSTFPLKATLEKHKRRHRKEDKKFKCTQCNMKYYDNSSLKRHILMKHTNTDYKLPCSYCNKKYTTVTNLKMHVNKHHTQ